MWIKFDWIEANHRKRFEKNIFRIYAIWSHSDGIYRAGIYQNSESGFGMTIWMLICS